MNYVFTVLAAAILLVVMVLLVSIKPRLSKLVTIWALVIAAGGGLLIYSYGYMDVTGNLPLAILSALLAVCGSFVGADEYSVIPDSPALQTLPMQLVCTFIRICAMYVTASTVITAIGAGALQRLRMWLSRRGSLNLIYGTNEDAPQFARQLLEAGQGSVIFIVNQPGEDYAAAIAQAGCVLRTDTHSLQADQRFLKSIGLGRKNRTVTLYALDADSSANIHYARALQASLQQNKADPNRLHLVIIGRENAATKALQASAHSFGYGFVTTLDTPEMAARLMIQKVPPCNEVAFDEHGRATEDFEALVIGFGQVGQSVLKALIMNGQFSGSQFRAAVFDPEHSHISGNFPKQLCDKYQITFYDDNAQSRQLYDYLDSRGNKLKYVAVCAGDQKLNREIGEALLTYFQNAILHIPVCLCARNNIQVGAPDGIFDTYGIFSTDVLCTDKPDRMAMILNHRYQANQNRTLLENWMDCDYFSRQSCRASADFLPAMLRAAGKTPEQALHNWALSDSQLQNLSITEHLRWCAFHYCMGYSPMTDTEFSERAELYLQQKQSGKPLIRISKNTVNRTHACLIPWEELDNLSVMESGITGNRVNYKAMDTDNVLAIPELLKQL